MIGLSSLDRIASSKMVLLVFSPSAAMLGVLMAVWPTAFWRWVGIEVGQGALIASLYGCVLLGVAVVGLAAFRAPRRHATLFLFIGSYKAVAVILLSCQALQHPLPVVGWVIVLLYVPLALISLWLYSGLLAPHTGADSIVGGVGRD